MTIERSAGELRGRFPVVIRRVRRLLHLGMAVALLMGGLVSVAPPPSLPVEPAVRVYDCVAEPAADECRAIEPWEMMSPAQLAANAVGS